MFQLSKLQKLHTDMFNNEVKATVFAEEPVAVELIHSPVGPDESVRERIDELFANRDAKERELLRLLKQSGEQVLLT